MATYHKVSLPVIRRLPKYYRYISDMKKNGVVKVSSSELAKMMGTTASQVRQDFNCFGGFGQQGIGYQIDVLLEQLTALLFNERKLKTILIGTGRLGRTISSYLMNETRGYELIAAFDCNAQEIGKSLTEHLIIHDIADLKSICGQEIPDVAVLCIPRKSAMNLAPELVEMGIESFWNFSHYDLSVDYEGITVENVHLSDSLMTLSFRTQNR